jgi:hypothetical protein
LENGTLFAHRTRVWQRKYLKSTGIRENALGPAHKAMNAPEALEDLGTGPQKKVISISKKDLGTSVFEGLRKLRFHCSLRTNRHENGSLHRVMKGAKRSGASAGIRGGGLHAEAESRGSHE